MTPRGRAQASDAIFLPEALLADSGARWDSVAQLAERDLLRLAILRDSARALHAAVSRSLAAGSAERTSDLKAAELRAEELKTARALEGSLVELVTDPKRAGHKSRVLPAELLLKFGPERLKRYDRAWENALAAEAHALGWSFWTLTAWVSIPRAEEWNRALAEKVWPRGIVLFAESSEDDEPSRNGLWQGRWFLAVDGRLDTPDPLFADILAWPGTPESPPSAPRWKSL